MDTGRNQKGQVNVALEKANGEFDRGAVQRKNPTYYDIAHVAIYMVVALAAYQYTTDRSQYKEDLRVIKEAIATINTRTYQLESFQAETRGNRFTSADGALVWRRISEIEGKLPARVPPEWFETFVRDIDNRLRVIERDLQSHANKQQ